MQKIMKQKKYKFKKSMSGFSLIELMVSMGIGMFLVAGVFTVYINGNDSRRTVEGEVKMIDDAQFALDIIAYDIRHAGLWGRLKEADFVDKTSPGAITGDCSAGWSVDVTRPVFAFDDPSGTSPYASCGASFHATGGDVIEMRYTMSQPVESAALNANTVYINGDTNQAKYHIADSSIVLSPVAKNYQAVANAYYVKSWSDVATDNIPSLHQVSLQSGPAVVDNLILSGVEDLQIQFGLDLNGDGSVNQYVNPGDAVMDWSKVITAQIWIVVRSLNHNMGMDTGVTFTAPPFAGGQRVFANDGFRRQMHSTVVQLRDSTSVY